MEDEGAAKWIARWVALGALFLIPFTPLIVANGYFFPFISGKAFFFRILVEIAVAAWAVLACLDKEYRPRFSLVGAAVLAFVVWMFVADLFAVNVAKAMWSNFERMEGWVLLVHLLGLFYAAGAVLRVEKKWRAWFLTSLLVSIYISVYAYIQLGPITISIPDPFGLGPFRFVIDTGIKLAIHQGSVRIDATLGNSAYLAIYFLFNVFIALWLALTEKYKWLKWSLLALATVEGVLIFFTETRGTIIGLVLGLALAAFLTTMTAGQRACRVAAGALAGIVIITGGFYLERNSDFVQHNTVLQRIASISLSDGETRFTIWHMAFQGALERPLTGWGQEGFNYIFNKFYDPSLYRQETWFDRAHNAFIDWLTAGGLPAFLLYLSLFGTAITLLWRGSELSRPERIALTCALVGYAVHNLFVFDNLYSYVYFFVILALIDSRVARPIQSFENTPTLGTGDGIMYALPAATVAAIAVIWIVNAPGMSVASKLITAISTPPPLPIGSPSTARLDLLSNFKAFENLAAHPSFAGQEIREQIVSFAASIVQSSQVADADKQKAVSLAVSEMRKQTASYPKDAREHLELSYAYRTGGDSANSLKEIQAALALSPKKEEMWIEAGATEWDIGDSKAAQTDFNTAYTLGPQFPELAAYAAAGDFAVGDRAAADKILIGAYGTTTVDSDILAVGYYRAKEWPRLIALWKVRTAKSGATASTWFSLAAAYYAAGDKANAIKSINSAVTLNPGAASAGAAAIKQIKAGQ